MTILIALCPLFVALIGFLVVAAGVMKVFTKAGQPGIMAFVPVYNGWLLVTEVCKMEAKWFIFSLIPFVNIFAAWMISQELAKKFGKSEGFGMGLFFLGPIFILMLGFGDAKYRGGMSLDFDDEEEEEEEERPRKKKRVEEEEEEERPRKKKRRVDDDEE